MVQEFDNFRQRVFQAYSCIALFKPFVERLLKAGKPPKVIIIAIMRKLLMITHSVLKSGLPFDANRYKCA